MTWPHIAVSAANLPDGRILTWSGSERDIWPTTEQTYSATWNPETGEFIEVFHEGHNMFCAHLSMLEDGRVFVNGGRNQTNSPWTSIFDFRDNEWLQIENMDSGGRWYPTTVTLGDGDVFTAIGTASLQRYPERWNVDTGWEIQNGIDFNDMVLDDYFSSGTHGESRWWPLLHVAPNGQIFHSGPTPKMHYIDPAGSGSYQQTGPQMTDFYHKHGTTIMYDEGKLLTAGGWVNGTNISSSNKAFTIDINGPSPVVANTADMNHARKFHNGVMLPTGEVLVVGGNTSGIKFNDSGTIYAVEIWDPDTGTWKLGADMATPRNYHSIALLMTDGRVLAAGGGYCAGSTFCNGASHMDAEVYSPPYLFNNDGTLATRPEITSGPGRVSSGEVFTVTATPGISKFSLIKMGSTTHGMNTDVRYIEISHTETSPGTYELTAHSNQNVLIPGYWMLFAVDANEVPSEAHVVQANTTGMPWIATIAQQSSQEGEAVSVFVKAGDADDDPLQYSAIGLPAGLSINSATGEISGSAVTAGFYDATVTVTDNDEGSRSKTFSWLVFGQGFGSIRRDWWTGVSGTEISSLTNLADFPDTPDGSESLVSFETPTDFADNYGTRVHGYLTPDVSGDYTFYIASDDAGELWLSSDANPANKQLIASVPGWSNSREWTKFPEQQSALISLEADKTYFIEALHKEGGGGDNLAVAWTRPGTGSIDVIPGAYLSPNDVSIRAPSAAQLHSGSITSVGSGWVAVDLPQSYDDMIIVATPEYSTADAPAVVRVRQSAPNQFELRIQNPGDGAVSPTYGVHYLVGEKGVYSGGGAKFELAEVTSTVVDTAASWNGQEIAYQQSYAAPVVVGQVMGDADPGWSSFWASNGLETSPPSPTSIFVGRHVGADTDTTRVAEQIGYMVFESGAYQVAQYSIESAIGSDSIEGIDNSAPYSYALGSPVDSAVLSSAGMDGGDGGWPVLLTPNTFALSAISLAIDEDQIVDAERAHTNEQVAFVALTETDIPLSLDPVVSSPEETGTSVAFNANANGGANLEYNWNWGDGSPESGFGDFASASHTYASPGRYVVSVTVRDPVTLEEISYQFIQLVHMPLTPTAPTATSTIALQESLDQVWVVNPDQDSVTVITDVAMQTTTELGTDDHPVAVQVAPNGDVWVVNRKSATVSIFDANALSLKQTLALASGSAPYGIAFHHAENVAFIVQEGTGELLKLDAGTYAVLGSVYIGDNVRHVGVTADGAKALVTRFVTPTLPDEWTASPIVEFAGQKYGGEVVFVDPFSMSILSTVVLEHSDRVASEHTGPGIPNYLGPAVVSPDGTSAWVPSKQDNILAGALRGGMGMTFDQTVRAISSKIDLGSDQEDFTFRVDHDNASVGKYAAFGPWGAYLFTTLEGNREIAVSDVYTATELLRFDVGRAPHGIALSSDGMTLYVHNFMDRTVGVFDVSSITHSNVLSASETATISTVATETLAPQVLQGKQFFYDARDPRLALDSYMSCASCHNDGGQDGRIWDFTGVGEGLRNTITLRGRAATAHGFLHWSANFDELQDFEDQIRNFSMGTGLMDNADYFVGTRNTSLGDAKAGISPDLDALAAYVASLDEFDASPHRNADGTLTAAGEAGRLVFEAEGCDSCHQAPRFTDSTDETTLRDVGTIQQPTSGSRLGGSLDGIDTPSLISIWNTAPYLHDGSAQDITEAVAAHSGISLTPQQLNDLGVYLEQLDGETASVQSGSDCTQCLDFDDYTIVSYSGQDRARNSTISDGGATITLRDNSWRRTAETFNITPTTILEFDFESTSIGEIHGIGFDEDNRETRGRVYFLHGTQSWGRLGYSYVGSGKQRFQIPVGQDFTGSAMHLTFVNDNDAGSGNDSIFSNVRIFDPAAGPQAPVIVNPGDQDNFVDQPLSLDIGASDANGDILRFTAIDLPPGLSISTDGTVSGTPSAEGVYFPTVTVTDDISGSDSATFQWTISCSVCPEPPSIENPGEQRSNVGDAVSLQVVATDINNDPLTFSASGLPAGLSISLSGLISGVPTVVGDYNVLVTVDDFVSGPDSASFVWTIRDPGNCVDCLIFAPGDTESFARQDASRNVEFLDGGLTVVLRDNTWRRTLAQYEVTPNTVIEFTFESSIEGEIHGIGFDADNGATRGQIFQLYGTQNYGIRPFTYVGPGPQEFTIPVGQYYTGTGMHLFFVNDDDARIGSESIFSTIRIYEQ